MRLVVEDEHVRRGSMLGVGRRLVHFDRADLEERFAEGFVDSNEGRGQTTRSLADLAAAGAHLPSCSSLNQASSSREPGARRESDMAFLLGFICGGCRLVSGPAKIV